MYSSTGNASSATAGERTTTIAYPIPHSHQFHHPAMIASPFISGGDEDEFPRRDERFPQWGNQETRDLIQIRGDLEFEFIATKRNKNLWETVANGMREKGYRRTPDQCKCKWKNLVNRYKGQDAADVENGRLCPFFDELHTVFTARENRMNQTRTQINTETGGQKRDRSREDVSEERDHEEETEVDQDEKGQNVLRRNPGKEKQQKTEKNESKDNTIVDSIREIMRNLMVQQQRIDLQWRESMEKRAEEREIFEQEWREKMEKLERERLTMEKAWRERDEQRRLREETRAEKRDALLTMLLNKLVGDKSS